MVEKLVTDERLTAGSAYVDALGVLGLRPAGAFWSVRPDDDNSLELSIVTTLVDRIGTLAIYEALFDAHDRAKTPSNFDPWCVGLYSPDQLFAQAVSGFDFSTVDHGNGAAFILRQGVEFDDGERRLRTLDRPVTRIVRPGWVYIEPKSDLSVPSDSLRDWRRFEKALAVAA